MSAHNTKNSPRRLRRAATFMARALLILAATASPHLARAAADDAAETQARWFQVELILFSQQTDLALDAEQWPTIEGLALPEKLRELSLPQPPLAQDAGEPDAMQDIPPLSGQPTTQTVPAEDDTDLPLAYQILPAEQHQLTDIAAKIRRSGGRDLLLHVAWQQPTSDRQQADPVYLVEGMTEPLSPVETAAAGNRDPITGADAGDSTRPLLLPEYASEADHHIGPANPRFAGTVTLSVERYLHIATDLVYRRPVIQHQPIPVSDLDLWYDRPYPTLKEPQGPAYQQMDWAAIRGFQLKESRRMRSTEIHYLDHPFMGMVVVVTPVALPEPAAAIQQTSPQNILLPPLRTRPTP
ncbi:MAG: CsiV family protein [Gammaproteobacteria bacterium]|nr:CsiV family protein [Gammaproteobacteria bacterium]